jgi:CMP/dCMP kinase
LDETALTLVASKLEGVFKHQDKKLVILLAGKDVSLAIRNEETAALASKVASIQSVRDALLTRQRDFRVLPGLVADGRDMGTVVFTDATLKVFLTASSEERAKRRVTQLEGQGQTADYDKILSDIKARDDRDMNRTSAPLKPAADALIIDSSVLSIDQVVAQIEAALANVN